MAGSVRPTNEEKSMITDAEQGASEIAQRLGGKKLIVVSNREPYIHSYLGEEIEWSTPASGLVTGLEPVVSACGGTWIAHGSGDADREVVDDEGKILVPPGNERYTLKRVWLSKEEEEGYYYGVANRGVWPLCHLTYTRPRFDDGEWQTYRDVNRKFARAVLEEVGTLDAVVFIQDYHFALLARMLKEERPELVVAQFWHIPWPNPESFRICPWGEEILDGLLGNDLLGFHIQYHCNNFLSTVERRLEAVEDYEHFSVLRGGHQTFVRPFPISVDYQSISRQAQSLEVEADVERLRHTLGLRGQLVGLGVDRVDYTKGIPERFRAIDRFLERYPQYHKRFTFLQVGPMSRIQIPEYQTLNDELYHLLVEINRKYGADHWVPIRIFKANYSRKELLSFFRLADVCIISSLHDGMNLVAKEFVSSCRDDSVLILSEFTGAARELTDALLINPYYIDGFADAIKMALEMPDEEKKRRMDRMLQTVSENDIYNWATRVFTEMSHLSSGSS